MSLAPADLASADAATGLAMGLGPGGSAPADLSERTAAILTAFQELTVGLGAGQVP